MKGEAFSCARVLIETGMIESIGGTVIIVCDGHHCKVAIREVPMCPSAPCSLASSLESTMLIDFPTKGGSAMVQQTIEKADRHHIARFFVIMLCIFAP